MAILSSIRRWHKRDQMPIREIVRRTGLSRHTIKKYLRNTVVEPRYPKRKTPSCLDAYNELLVTWLKSEANKGAKYKFSLKQLYKELIQKGFQGSYDITCRYAR